MNFHTDESGDVNSPMQTAKCCGYRITYKLLTAGDLLKAGDDPLKLLNIALGRVYEAQDQAGAVVLPKDLPAGDRDGARRGDAAAA